MSGGVGWGRALERAGEKSQRQNMEVIRSGLEKHNQIVESSGRGSGGSEKREKQRLEVACY